ncbi:hypothetical protein KPL74_08880 [Bacillus sp. NP157]|nr:hypothetical protein KPL74_08880 [Bacillus sp. NP157]
MKTSRGTPSAPQMRRYFEQTGFVLEHRVGANGKPEAWWLADVDETPYPMPAHWRPRSLQAGESTDEVAEFPTLARLWRAWAATQQRFAREARCIELIREHLVNASPEERAEVDRWIDLNGEPREWYGKKIVDIDETRWPWCAIRQRRAWHIEGVGWPWSTIPESPADGLEIQRREGWADDAVRLHWFDMRYAVSYFTAVRAVMDGTLQELVSGSGAACDEDGGEGDEPGAGDVIDGPSASVAGTEGGTSGSPTLH